ncbi:dimeris T4 recombination endonuclease VII [Escherichia phage ZCEC13]|uniref:Dimeris T4 recombination endonuclease VII n=1 Tax=Escherichia phage ZCEC13 TaxID=2935866 RepID=A0AAE9HDH4_9CAUD|nr:dimeris T4 recombination endonuclease VII [Escherichia phage ZCEC13]UPU16054.1 dimeris T4 recombination endonuclease VII [Escherichia phage ZCEC13]
MVTVKNISARPFMMPGEEDVMERMLAPGDSKEFEVTPAIYSLVSAYQEAGELVVISGELKNPESDVEDVTIDKLRAEAEELGIKVDTRWKKSRLQQEIEAAKAAS